MRLNAVLIFFGLVISSQAQTYVTNQQPEFYFNQAITHYQSGDFMVAKHLLDEYLRITQTPEALYYRAMSAVKSEQKSGEHYIQSFLKDYPLHPLAHQAQFELAHSYFKKRQYQKVVRAYEVMKMSALDKIQKEQAFFEKGYSLLQLKQSDKGIAVLERANDLNGEYKYMSAYYLGVMSKGSEAEGWFIQAAEDEEWQIKSAVYLSQIYLSEEKYEKLIERNLPLLSTTKTKDNYDLHLYTGEAYYRQARYKEASRYLSEGVSLGVAKPTSEMLFKLGHAYYEIDEKDLAVEQLKKSGLNESPTGQASAFQLGKIYTEQGKFPFALHAFEVAGSSDHDIAVQEESRFLAAKINVQLEQFDEAIEQLESFVDQYPSSSRANESDELLSTAYLNTSNYDRVIEHFERRPSQNPTLRKNYQKVTLLKGGQAFSDRKVNSAVSYLKKSVNTPVDRSLEFDGYFWLGECYVALGDANNARDSYQKAKAIKGSSGLPDYGLGYLEYNEKKYAEARVLFQSYQRKENRSQVFYSDAALRIADCDYALKKYDEALAGYGALKRSSVAQDYLSFQIGIIHQMNGGTEAAVEAYQEVNGMNGSPYRDNALFQMAMTYFEDANFENAEAAFTSYIKQFPEEDLAPYARIKRGLCYFNTGANGKSKKDYFYVLDNHIHHSAAQDALLGIQELQKQGESIDFDEYLAKYRAAHPDDSSLESIEFEQAKNLYFAQSYEKAITQFLLLKSKNPEGPFKEDIIYYLADANDRLFNNSEANGYYEEIIANAPSRYLNRSLDKRGKLLLRTNQNEKAIANYQLLKQYAKNRKEAYLSNEGLMKGHYQSSQFEETIRYAREITNADWKPSNAGNQAALYIGRSLKSQGKNNEAMDEFLTVINGGSDELSAEAKYQIAEIQFGLAQHQQSLETLFQLNSDYANYQGWVGKSFLLIADNYMTMGELLQAKATLNSLIDNFPNPDIKKGAEEKLKEIETMQLSEVANDTIR